MVVFGFVIYTVTRKDPNYTIREVDVGMTLQEWSAQVSLPSVG